MIYSKLNGNDLIATYGIYVVKGGYALMNEPPKRKEIYSHSWNDEDGTDRETSAIKFESKSIALPLFIKASSVSDFQTKWDAFKAVVMAPGRFTLDIILFNRRWTLLFDSITDFKFFDLSSSKVIATFTLNIIDDTPNTVTPIPV